MFASCCAAVEAPAGSQLGTPSWVRRQRPGSLPSQVLRVHLTIAQASAAAAVDELPKEGAVADADYDSVLLALQQPPEVTHPLLHSTVPYHTIDLRRSMMYFGRAGQDKRHANADPAAVRQLCRAT